MRFAPGRHSLEAAPESLAHRSNIYHKLPIPAAFADMRESKKVESGRLPPSRLFRFRQSLPPERNQSADRIFLRDFFAKCKEVLMKTFGINHLLTVFSLLRAES